MKMYSDWYAILDKARREGEDSYFITPKSFWLKYRSIPDSHANLNLYGLDEICAHCVISNYKTNLTTKELLINYGFDILDNPDWYYLDKEYPAKLQQQEFESMSVTGCVFSLD